MKYIYKIILLLVFLCYSTLGQVIPSNEINGTYDSSSYDVGYTSYMGDYFATYFYCMYPQYTNHIYSWSRGGSGWNGDYQAQEEKWCLPIWYSFKVPGYNWILANDNESLVSNTTYSAGLLIAAGPPLFYNGTAQTNEGITTIGIQTIPLGRPPHDSTDGDSGAVAGNAGSMKLAIDLGVSVIDLWHAMWTNGVSADQNGNRYVWHPNFSGSHFSAGGGLINSVYQLKGLNVETNVGILTFNWNGGTASSIHSVANSISVLNDVLTATVLFDRMPMAFDANGGNTIGSLTNDARYATLIDSSIGNSFNWIIQVTNLPPGNYEIDVDGHYADSCTSTQLVAGRNWFTNCVPTNPLWQQRSNVLAWKRWQKGAIPDTLQVIDPGAGHASHIPGAIDSVFYQSHANFLYDNNHIRGMMYMTNIISGFSMTNEMRLYQQYDIAINQAAQQTNHTFTIIRLPTTLVTNSLTFPTSGNYYRISGFQPADNIIQQYNPPIFKWIYSSNVLSSSNNTLFNFKFELTTNAGGDFSTKYWSIICSNNFYNFVSSITNPDGSTFIGLNYWRIIYMNSNMTVNVGTSAVHSFTMASNSVMWNRSMLADTNYLLSIATNHPHMWVVSPTNLFNIGKFVKTNVWDTHNQSWSTITNQAITLYQAQSWWGNSTITNSAITNQGTALSAITGAWEVAFSYYMSGSNAMFDISGACASLDYGASAFQQQNLDFQDPYTVDTGAEQEMAYAYDWLYPFMTTSQRLNVRTELKFLAYYGAYGPTAGNAWFYDSFPSITNRIYGGSTLTVPFYSAFKIGTSHARHDNSVGTSACIATMGEDSDMLGLFSMFANYSIFQLDPDQGDEGRGYAEQDNFKYDREFVGNVVCIVQFPEAKLWQNPVLTNLTRFFAQWEPVGYRGVFEPWGDLTYGFINQWYHFRYHDLALITGSGPALRQYNRSYTFRINSADEYPIMGEVFLNYYFPKPTESDWPDNFYLDLERGWAMSSSLPSSDWGAFTNGVNVFFQARPAGARIEHSSFTDGQVQLTAFGADCTAGGAADGYAKHPMYYDGLMVDGIGVRNWVIPPSDPVYNKLISFTNTSDYAYMAGDLTLGFNRTNSKDSGLGDQTLVFYQQPSNTVSYVRDIERHVFFPHHKYLVIYDKMQTSIPAQFQSIWHIAETNSIVDTNNCAFTYTCTNVFNGSNVTVYVKDIVNPSLMSITNLYGTNFAKFNPFTKENRFGVDLDDGPYYNSTIWAFNNIKTTNWHFLRVVFPVKWGQPAPTITRIDDNTVKIDDNLGTVDIVTFSPDYSGPFTFKIPISDQTDFGKIRLINNVVIKGNIILK